MSRLMSTSVLSATALALLAQVLVAPSAHARPGFNDQSFVEGGSYVVGKLVGTSDDCEIEGTPSATKLNVTKQAPRATVAIDDTETVTAPDDDTDVATVHVTGQTSARITGLEGTPRSIHYTSTLAADVDSTTDTSACSTAGGGTSSLWLFLEVKRPTLAYVTSTTTGDVDADTSVSTYDDRVAVGTDPSRTLRTAILLKAGEGSDVRIDDSVRVTKGFPDEGAYPATAAGTHTVDVKLVVAGTALTAPQGRGRSFVEFGRNRSCHTDNVRLAFARPAARVRRAVVLVNGEVAKVVTSPAVGTKIGIGGAAATSAERFVVRLTLDNGAVRRVTRSYAACAALPGDGSATS